MKAYQRLVRERDGVAPDATLDIGRAQVRPISKAQARAIVEAHEYLGKMPALVRYCFGLFFGDRLGGVVVYATEIGENLAVWTKYGYTGKIICLARGVCLPWAHPHSASKLIRGSIKLLPERYQVITATVDAEAGEIGVVYQAAGFDYVGVMSKGGRIVDERAHRHKYKTTSVRKLRRRGVRVKRSGRKARYFAFNGTRAQVRTLRAAIKYLIKDYPKRVSLGPRLIGVPGGKAGPGRGKKTASIVRRFKWGNSREYTVARLSRDHPELALRVLRGELSAHRAAIEAGRRREY